jgi:hypothetical protein
VSAAFESALGGLSYPHDATSSAFLAELVTAHAYRSTERFLDRHRAALATAGGGWETTLARAFDALDFDNFWDASTVRIAEHANDPAPLFAAFLLHLNTRGIAADWSLSFPAPATLSWDDHPLPAATAIAVVGEGAKFELGLRAENGDAHGFTLESIDGAWTLDGRPSTVPRIRFDRRSIALGPRVLPLSDWPTLARPSEQPLSVSSLESAAQLLRRAAPNYLEWVDRVLRAVVPAYGTHDEMQSQSHERWPGVIAVSFPAPVAAIAEMLVHESSHQYLHLAKLLGPLTNGTDQRKYFSPLKDSERPLEAILIAFHAVANMILFYRACRAAGADADGYCAHHEARHTADFVELAEHLEGNSGLSELGIALFRPAMTVLSTR